MADRYWVGGTANWDGTAGTKWATTSGGTGGASVPTSVDDVFFDSASGVVTCTLTAATCRTITCTGFIGTLTLGGNWNIYGSIVFSTGMTFNGAGFTLNLYGSGATILSSGKPFNCSFTILGSYTLADALGGGVGISLNSGSSFNTAGYNLTGTSIISGGASSTITLGASTLTLSNSWNINIATALNAGTSTINLSGATFNGFGLTYNNVNFSGASPVITGANTFNNVSFTSTTAGTSTISGLNTFNNLSITGPSAAGIRQVTFDSRQTINGALSTTGTAGNRRVLFRGNTFGIAQTLNINTSSSLADADFRDVYVTGAPVGGTRIGDLGGCRGITFSAPKSVYWVTPAGGNWSGNNWAATSGGTANTDNYPLIQDTAIIENTGLNTSATVTLDAAIPYVGSVNMSTRTNAMSIIFGVDNFPVYGDWTNGSGTGVGWSTNTWATVFAKRGGTQTITSAGKGWQRITVNSFDGTVKLADSCSIGYIFGVGFTLTSGTIDLNGQTLTGSGSATPATVVIGASPTSGFIFNGGTLICPASVTPFQDTSNGLCTFSAGPGGNGTIRLSSSFGPLFSSAGNNYPCTLDLQVGSAGISGNNTFANITISPPAAGTYKGFYLSGNQTVTGTLTCAGGSAVGRVLLYSNVIGTPRTLTVGTLAATDCDFRDITIAGPAAGSSPTRAGNLGGNSGITFPSPKTVYWNLAGTQNWEATAWASSSGGTPNVNNFPLAQDTAVFDNAGVAGTVTMGGWNIGNVDMSARTSAMTLTSGSPTVLGDWKWGTGVTSTSNANAITFAKRGTQTITSNGVTFGSTISINSFNGVVRLADALVVAQSRDISLTSGTFDAAIYNVTTWRLVGTGGTVMMGSGLWTLTGTGIVWNVGSNGVGLIAGTADLLLSDNTTASRSITHANGSFNKLTIGGTTSTSVFGFAFGNHQFKEIASTKTVAHTIDFGTWSQTFGKWSVTGTAGNVVTLTGTATTNILAGSATSGIDYLAMGSVGFSATSPGEFYAGANSTGTAGAPVYRTAAPSPRTLYWVGGTGNWSNTARWSTTSGGTSGAAIPTSLDAVIFDSASNATAYTATVDATSRCNTLTIAGPASGNVTLAGTAAIIAHGNTVLPTTGLTRTYTGSFILSGSTAGKTFTTNGNSLANSITVNGVGAEWTLGSALTNTGGIVVTSGVFNCSIYNVTDSFISSDNGNIRTVNFGSSTLNLSGSTPINFGTTQPNSVSLTTIPGTSQINCSAAITTFNGNNKTFYNVSFNNTNPAVATSVSINGQNTFNNLEFYCTGFANLITIFPNSKPVVFSADQTINGTLSSVAVDVSAYRLGFGSNTLYTKRTLTCAATSLVNVDFSDIEIIGAAAPASGVRLGDCGGNSGINFVSTTKYWNATGGGGWTSTVWATTPGGTPNADNYPLPQDTCIVGSTGLNSGASISFGGNFGGYRLPNIDLSARTTNTMTFSGGTSILSFYGDLILGSGVTISVNVYRFLKRSGTQNITSAGKVFSGQSIFVDNTGGTLTLNDALTVQNTVLNSLGFSGGTINLNGYTLTLSMNATGGPSISTNLDFGSGGTIVCPTSLSIGAPTISGTGSITLNAAGAKTFNGNSLIYSNITLNQAGAGTLTITGNNTFANITNSYKTTGATTIALGNTIQSVANFTASGEPGRLLTITGASASSPATIVYTGVGSVNSDYLTITGIRAFPTSNTWYSGNNSVNNGSLGWTFAAATAFSNMLLMFF